MKLYEKNPDRIEYNGREYVLNLSWYAVLMSIDIFSDDSISEYIQVETALDNLVKGKHPVDGGLLDAIFSLIFPDKQNSDTPVIDFEQDKPLIIAAFQQAYNIDLCKSDMHWVHFHDLLSSIPRETKLAEIIDIRQRPIPEPTKYNAAERAALIAAKARVAIKHEGGFEKSLMNLYKKLESQAKGG